MIEVKVHDRDGTDIVVQGEVGVSLMETLRDTGIEISSICGGTGSCGTCHVHLAKDWFDQISKRGEDELDLLETLPAFDPHASRLSCQICLSEAMNGLELKIAADI